MRVTDALALGKSKVHSDMAKLLLSDLLGKNPLELYLCLEDEVDDAILEQYKKELQAIEEGSPIQYAIGHVQFYGNQFYVNKNVLIPRFETEELVEKTIQKIAELFEKQLDLSLIDLGCGSGVIGLTLKDKLPSLNVTLLDISEEALQVTKQNQEALNLEAEILKGNMLEDIHKKYDIIISNPPYIRDDEDIEDIVKKNEPALALYGGEDGLKYYEQILSKAAACLNSKFLIAFEIGCEQKDAIASLARKYLENIQVECLKDMQGRDRMIFIYPQ